MGEFQLCLLAPDVKKQLWGWQDAQLAAKQSLGRWRTKRGDTGKWQGSHNSRNPGKTAFCPLARQLAGEALPNPPDVAQTLPNPILAAWATGQDLL